MILAPSHRDAHVRFRLQSLPREKAIKVLSPERRLYSAIPQGASGTHRPGFYFNSQSINLIGYFLHARDIAG
jgi:hypothetical protein